MSQAGSGDVPGRLPKALLDDKYGYFSDPSIKDRLAFHTNRMSGNKRPPAYALEPSGPASGSSWDKYFFFSCPPDKAIVGPSAMKGRRRPAVQGPQTFQMTAFSKERIAEERTRIEALGPRTSYTEMFGQFPRTTLAEYGPPGECHNSGGGNFLSKSASDSMIGAKPPSDVPDARVMAAHELLDRQRPEGRVRRHGPMWPPPGPERPDPIKSRQNLFRGAERTVVDLYATDRKAPASCHYLIPNF